IPLSSPACASASATTCTNPPSPASSPPCPPRPDSDWFSPFSKPNASALMSLITEQIEQQIAQLSSKAVKKNTGTIRSVADGVARVDGLSEVMYNEMVQFPGSAIGIALN